MQTNLNTDTCVVWRSATLNKLRDSKIMASMGSKGDLWDNACAESCISTIKNELVKRRTFVTRDQARLALFATSRAFTTR